MTRIPPTVSKLGSPFGNPIAESEVELGLQRLGDRQKHVSANRTLGPALQHESNALTQSFNDRPYGKNL